MKSFALVALFVAGAAANYGYTQPAVRTQSYGGSSDSTYGSSSGSSSTRTAPIAITRFQHDIRGSESSSLEYETGNGIKMTDNTRVVQGRGGSYTDAYGQQVQGGAVLNKEGSYSYTSPEGKQISLSWTADENGFHARGEHLPTSPPIPADIAASLRSGGYSSSSYSAPAAPAAPAARGYGSPMRSSVY